MNRTGLCIFAITSAFLFACSASSSPDTTADNGGADEIVAKVATCDESALASDRLQPGVKGGPDAKSAVTCEAGYTLCKIDPNGKDNDVCSNPTNCYACSKAKAPSPSNACVAAGGKCVALYPGSCSAAKIGDARTYSCGGGVGVECCLP